MEDRSSMFEFVGIGEMAETTTHMLALSLQQLAHASTSSRLSSGDTQLGRVEKLVLQQAREYVRKVREGFMLSVRTDQVIHFGEIDYLLDRVLSNWDELSEELGWGESQSSTPTTGSASSDMSRNTEQLPEQSIKNVRYQLLSFGMAAVALGYLPRLPAKQITFPHSYSNPPTYSDIPVPSTPGEMLSRIEELEQTIWRMASSSMQELVQRRYGPLRRTYGFFEASAWLSRKEAERFGIKRRQTNLSFF